MEAIKNKKGKILVYFSSARKIPLKNGGYHSTGIFLGELVEVLKPLIEDYELAFVSPNGKRGEIDKNSRSLKYWGFNKNKLTEAEHMLWRIRQLGMEAPMELKELLKDKANLEEYDMLFIPGGHSVLTDIVYENWAVSENKNKLTGELIQYFHEKRKLIGLICHSTVALITVEGEPWPFVGYKMTAISTFSEYLSEDIPLLRTVHGHIKEYPVNMLKQKGAKVVNHNFPTKSLVVEDRNLITGQDPYSAMELGIKIKLKLDNYIEEKRKPQEKKTE